MLHGGSRKEQSDTVKEIRLSKRTALSIKYIKNRKTDIVKGVDSLRRILKYL